MKRREFLKETVSSIAGLSLISLANCSSKQEPNIVWIIADDLSPDLGCYGDTVVHTPNIDRLAQEGMRFQNAFATNPVCSPSRSAIYTGMYQTTLCAHQHRTFNRSPLPDPVKVITEYFKEAGYFTCNGHGIPSNKPAKTDFNFDTDQPFDGTDWSQRQPGQPFFASVQFHQPHRTFENDLENPVDPDDVKIPPYYPDHPVTRKDWANYLETIQILDKRVGKLLKRVEDEGLSKNTVVFFFGDQGRPHVRGKQWLYEGGIRVPLIVRWPKQITPNTINENLVSLIDLAPTCMNIAGIDPPEHLAGQDIFNKDIPEREYIVAARDRCDAVVDYIRCVRTRKYKYIRNYYPERPYTQFGHYKAFNYPVLTLLQVLKQKNQLTPAQKPFMAEKRPAEELYDLEKDPYELNNLAGDPQLEKVLNSMRKQLDQWIHDTGDKGSLDPDNYEELIQRRLKKYGLKWKERGIDPFKTSPEIYLKWWEKHLGL